jgi:hypothetical protein
MPHTSGFYIFSLDEARGFWFAKKPEFTRLDLCRGKREVRMVNFLSSRNEHRFSYVIDSKRVNNETPKFPLVFNNFHL